jgi:hypothetical protein
MASEPRVANAILLGPCEIAALPVWCHRRTQRRWHHKEPPPTDIHYDAREFVTRSTMAFPREGGDWRVVHAHFSAASAGARAANT